MFNGPLFIIAVVALVLLTVDACRASCASGEHRAVPGDSQSTAGELLIVVSGALLIAIAVFLSMRTRWCWREAARRAQRRGPTGMADSVHSGSAAAAHKRLRTIAGSTVAFSETSVRRSRGLRRAS